MVCSSRLPGERRPGCPLAAALYGGVPPLRPAQAWDHRTAPLHLLHLPARVHGPRVQELWPDHPRSIAVREVYLLDGILGFFAKSIFHPQRHQRLAGRH
jgi:hypothetical protein